MGINENIVNEEKTIANTKQEINKLNEEIGGLKEKKTAMKGTFDKLNVDIAKENENLKNEEQQYDENKAELEALQEEANKGSNVKPYVLAESENANATTSSGLKET